MQIALYKNTSDPAVVGKTLTHVKTVSGTFRHEVNLIAPAVQLARDTDININTFNYLYIGDLNRYYFVDNITVGPNGLITLALSEDVLETYKHSIGDMPAWVERSESNENTAIPDPYALMLPKVTKAHHGMTSDYSQGRWDTLESIWSGDNDNTKLCYIIKLGYAQLGAKWGDTSGTYAARDYHTPTPIIICTKAYLKLFLEKVNSFGSSLIDKWNSFKDSIQTIECIPDGFMWNDPEYPSVNAGTAETVKDDSMVISYININGHEIHLEKDGTDACLYGFALSPNHLIRHYRWKWNCNIANTWQNSGTYKDYSLRFNPFGTFNIPADELLGQDNFYLYLSHSLITGQAQLSYFTDDANRRTILTETKLSFQQPFVKAGDFSPLVASVAKIAASAIVGGAIGAAGSAAETAAEGSAIPVTSSVEFTPDPNLVYQAGVKPGGTGAGNSFTVDAFDASGNQVNNPFMGGVRRSFNYQSAVSSNAAKSTSNSLRFSNVLSSLNSLSGSFPRSTLEGTLAGVMIDIYPTIVESTKDFILPSSTYQGKPYFAYVANLRSLYGFTKIGYYKLDSFGNASEPIPMSTELDLLGHALTTGIYITEEY